jgi:hypothetical protein
MLVQAGGTGTLQLTGGVQQQPLGMQTGVPRAGQPCHVPTVSAEKPVMG